jgi:hypothetical protein
MQNQYESSDVIQIGQAPSLILGEKMAGSYDWMTGDEFTCVIDPVTDIDE